MTKINRGITPHIMSVIQKQKGPDGSTNKDTDAQIKHTIREKYL